MIRDITIGQYYPADSVLHRLDPRLKLNGTLLFIISIFLFDTFYGYMAVTLFLISIIRLSKVPFKYILRGLKAIVVILLFTLVFNLFLTQGDLLIKIGFLKITKQGAHYAIFNGLRLTYLILGSSLMTFTTTPNQLTDGLERLLWPLRRIKVPVHEIAMMMSIALRFIPILLEETDKIMKAQMARGADFESGGVIKRAKGLVPLLVPLFVSAFRRANDLAMAMEARCYHGGEGRTKMKPLHYDRRDIIAYFILLMYFTAVIIIGIFEKRLPYFDFIK
jgi:energy-coupling factor transport system permease protein